MDCIALNAGGGRVINKVINYSNLGVDQDRAKRQRRNNEGLQCVYKTYRRRRGLQVAAPQ